MFDLTKTVGATFVDDAKACFDRIITALVKLHSRQLGCHGPPAIWMQTRRLMHYTFSRRGAGVSVQSYSPTVEHPLYGGDRALGGHLQRRLSTVHSLHRCLKRQMGSSFKIRTKLC
jgi:hypothetical protein